MGKNATDKSIIQNASSPSAVPISCVLNIVK